MQMRGHEAKLQRIIAALKAAGLPDDLRPVEFGKRVAEKAKELGYIESEIPSRTSIRRWRRKCNAVHSSNTSSARSDALR